MSRPEADRVATVAGLGKVSDRHRERLAVVYVRQSTPGQVQRHRESTGLQYGLVERAEAMGWPRSRILVIDDDLGRSGASADGRPGFQRLLGEVALDSVGLILGVEMSRLALSCKDWYGLLELCALFGTLICDLDGLYDPSGYNDRLLLGLKGTMSEAELHILRQRMRQGALQKARRGELVSKVPIGYVRADGASVEMDPDEQVRSFVHLVFEEFDRIGSAAGLLRWIVDRGLLVPVRADGGLEKGELQWRRPNAATVRYMLVHPMYAGAYVYGRTCQVRGRPRRGRPLRLPTDQWQVLLRDHYPAYIGWDRHQANLERLTANRSLRAARGAARGGRALLTGLVVCGRCGARMMTRYAGQASLPRYFCDAARVNYGQARCQGLAARAGRRGGPADARGPDSGRAGGEPAGGGRPPGTVRAGRGQWRRRLERASYEAERARRQYDAVEPENRLVARTLEAAWEEKLAASRALADEHERFLRGQPPRAVGADEEAEVRRLAADLPALWSAPGTTDADRKEVLRQIIEEVVVAVQDQTEWSEVRVRWAGGLETRTRARRPVARLEQIADGGGMRRRVADLQGEGLPATAIAERLAAEGRRALDDGPMTASVVRRLLRRYGLAGSRPTPVGLEPGEWLIPELAHRLDISPATIYSWITRGVVDSRRIGEGGRRRLVARGLGEHPDLASIHRHIRSQEPSDGPSTTLA
ncbi:recombinase family protein [Paludisphaera soli]|uniref:recombinase family protein n=1 Tax=Paludisphaera soli TaxID=2712865 RepID=UPI0013E9B5C1|nr:recombinase family protein [Paludisphaera soli]